MSVWAKPRAEEDVPQNLSNLLHWMVATSPGADLERPCIEPGALPASPEKASPKQRIPQTLRWDVWERDNFTCQHCGTRRNLTVDHVFPESRGGSLSLENLQTLCGSCNSRKGAR